MIPGLKREASEPLMALVPKRDPATSLKQRSSTLFSRSSSTSSITTEHQKARKKAQVEAELKDAITALKRPNRAMVGKEIVEETERLRASTSLSQLKKSRKPVRDPAFGRTAATGGVQVKATPANNRFRDVFAAETQAQLSKTLLEEDDVVKDEHAADDDERIPASSSVVPSSAAPQRVTAGFFYSSPAVNATPVARGSHVQATPARSAQAPAKASEVNLPVSPVLARKAVARRQGSQNAAPLPNSSTLFGGTSSARAEPLWAAGGIFETPLKPRSAMDMDELCTPIRPLRLVSATGAITASPEAISAAAVAATSAARRTAVATTQEAKRAEVVRPQAEKGWEDAVTSGYPPVSIYQQLGWEDDYDLD
jgi:DNA replication regulator SLD3